MDFAARFIKKSPKLNHLGFSLLGQNVFIVLLGWLPVCPTRNWSDPVSGAQRLCAHNAGYL